jgi:hypothetical protein
MGVPGKTVGWLWFRLLLAATCDRLACCPACWVACKFVCGTAAVAVMGNYGCPCSKIAEAEAAVSVNEIEVVSDAYARAAEARRASGPPQTLGSL